MCWLSELGVIGPGTRGTTTVPGSWSLGTVAVGVAQVWWVSTCAHSLWNWSLGFTGSLLWLVMRGGNMAATRALGWKGALAAWAQKAECSSSTALEWQVEVSSLPPPLPTMQNTPRIEWYNPSSCWLELCVETPGNWAQGSGSKALAATVESLKLPWEVQGSGSLVPVLMSQSPDLKPDG